MSVLVVSRN